MQRILRESVAEVVSEERRINGLNLSKNFYPPNLRQPRHSHEAASFSFVMAGSFVERCGRKSFLHRPSTVIFHPPEKSHAVSFEAGVRILNVAFDRERLAAVREYSAVLDRPDSFRTDAIDRLARRIYREFQEPDAFSALAIDGLTLEILAAASRRQLAGCRDFPRWLEQTRDFLHANFADSFFVADVARLAGVHPVHLARVFRRRFGCTIGEYVRRLRVDFARREISATETPLSEIALAAGFSDQSHLNRTFKSVFGRTPAEQRKLTRRS